MSDDAPALKVDDYGDAGLLVEVVEGNDEVRWRRARRVAEVVAEVEGVTDVLATYRHVFISVDPASEAATALRARLAAFPRDGDLLSGAPRRFDIPVVYGGEHGPDFTAVAQELSMTPEDLVTLHTSGCWTVRFIASPLGAPFLEGSRFPAPVRRMSTPRTRVPAGSIALSGQQCTIYAGPSPGGWRLIGRTPLTLFDLRQSPFVPYGPGDVIRFMPTDAWDGDQRVPVPDATVDPKPGGA